MGVHTGSSQALSDEEMYVIWTRVDCIFEDGKTIIPVSYVHQLVSKLFSPSYDAGLKLYFKALR